MQMTNNVRHEQWMRCQECLVNYPMSELRIQDARYVCIHGCFDPRSNTVRFREVEVSNIAGDNSAPDEGTDRRWVELALTQLDEIPR